MRRALAIAFLFVALAGRPATAEIHVTNSGGAYRLNVFAIDLPPDIVPGEYRGALILQGFRDGGIPLSVTVVDPQSQRKEPPAARGRRTRKRPATRTRRARR